MILLSLAVFGDIVRILPKSKRQSWNFWFGHYRPEERVFNRQSYTNTVSRLLRTKQIEKVIKNNRVKIGITPKGWKLLSMEVDLEKFSRKRWDGQWRTVVFDVEEKKRQLRDFLREKLKDLGFGMLQESVWLSPFPIEDELNELFEEWRLRDKVFVSKSRILVGDNQELASRVWHLDALNERYSKLVEAWESLSGRERSKKAAFDFQKSYFGLLWRDPFLPQELTSQPWFRDEARKIYDKEVLKILSF